MEHIFSDFDMQRINKLNHYFKISVKYDPPIFKFKTEHCSDISKLQELLNYILEKRMILIRYEKILRNYSQKTCFPSESFNFISNNKNLIIQNKNNYSLKYLNKIKGIIPLFFETSRKTLESEQNTKILEQYKTCYDYLSTAAKIINTANSNLGIKSSDNLAYYPNYVTKMQEYLD